MSTENWIQILLGVWGIVGFLAIRTLGRVERLLEAHEKSISDHETRITVIEKIG